MELNHLRYFYEVAKSGSFTAAARKLHISQSALSKAVALLEDAEGVQLLERSKKGVELTKIGREVYLKSEGIFQTLSDIQNACRGTKEVCEGRLQLGASDHITNYLLVKKVHEMQSKHPLVLSSIFAGTPHDIINAIISGEIEFGLFVTKVNTPSIHYDVVCQVPMAVVVHPKHLHDIKGNSRARLKAVINKTGFIGSIKAQYQRYPSQELVDVLGESPNIVFECNSQEAQKRFCLEGIGVAFLARFMVEDEIARGKLAEIELSEPMIFHTHVARQKGRPLSLSARTFIDLLMNND
jgi:DNA-binding transcriptional LysR family regulator